MSAIVHGPGPLALPPVPVTMEPLKLSLAAVSFPTSVTMGAFRRNLTRAELLTLNATPVPLIPGVADSIIVPYNWQWEEQFRVFGEGVAPSARLEYTGQANLTGLLSTLAGTIGLPNQYRFYSGSLSGSILPINVVNVGPTFANAPNPPVGADIELRGANMTCGNDSTWALVIQYLVVRVR